MLSNASTQLLRPPQPLCCTPNSNGSDILDTHRTFLRVVYICVQKIQVAPESTVCNNNWPIKPSGGKTQIKLRPHGCNHKNGKVTPASQVHYRQKTVVTRYDFILFILSYVISNLGALHNYAKYYQYPSLDRW